MITTSPATGRPQRRALMPLVLDVALPIACYYLLAKAFGLSDLASLAWSSVIPAARTGWAILVERRLNPLAALVLVVNAVGVGVSLLASDPRLLLAKESFVSGLIGLAIGVSVLLGRPLMSSVVRPIFARGDEQRLVAWDRLSAGSPSFRRAERVYSLIWSTALLIECVVRIVGAYTLPVDTMVWFGPVLLLAAIVLAFRVGDKLAIQPMKKQLVAQLTESR